MAVLVVVVPVVVVVVGLAATAAASTTPYVVIANDSQSIYLHSYSSRPTRFCPPSQPQTTHLARTSVPVGRSVLQNTWYSARHLSHQAVLSKPANQLLGGRVSRRRNEPPANLPVAESRRLFLFHCVGTPPRPHSNASSRSGERGEKPYRTRHGETFWTFVIPEVSPPSKFQSQPVPRTLRDVCTNMTGPVPRLDLCIYVCCRCTPVIPIRLSEHGLFMPVTAGWDV